jgi:hypothetical protein
MPKQIFSQNDVKKTLKGFNTLKVYVEPLDPEMERLGLTREQIQTDVEIKLRKTGFNVIAIGESFSPVIYLYITLHSYHSGSGSIAYYIETSLRQEVLLDRNTSVNIIASTWSSAELGIVSQSKVRQLRDQISKKVDKFINAWLKANASTTSEKETPRSTYVPPPPPPKAKQDDSPFTATYVGGNKLPTVEIFNDTDRTMYFDFGQERMTAYTIPSGGRQKINLSEAGNYKYKASAPRVRSDEGQETFNIGYVYTWRFYIVTVPR